MAIQRRTIVYDGPGGPFEGVFAWDDAVSGERPAVLIIPNVLGQKEFDNLKAEELAKLGYVALAADVFGQGKRTTHDDPDRSRYIQEMFADRPLLRDRLHASLATLKAQPEADASKTAAIGFCFGGLSVLDLARSGADVLGVVSFHGIYNRPPYDTATPMKTKVLVAHGWEDPLAKPESLQELATELTEAKADWQAIAYGHTGHAFTDAAVPYGGGFGYVESTARRSWKAMQDFLAEIFA